MEVKCKKYAKALKHYGYNELEDDDGEDEEEEEGEEEENINDHSNNLLEN